MVFGGMEDRKWGWGSKAVDEGEIVVFFIGLEMVRWRGGVDVDGGHWRRQLWDIKGEGKRMGGAPLR
jgi:hypothetical protein